MIHGFHECVGFHVQLSGPCDAVRVGRARAALVLICNISILLSGCVWKTEMKAERGSQSGAECEARRKDCIYHGGL
jgi:hypothetical protein